MEGDSQVRNYLASIYRTEFLNFRSVYRKSRDAPEYQQGSDPEKNTQTLKLTDQYLALLVAILTNAGLLEVSDDSMSCLELHLELINIGPLCNARGIENRNESYSKGDAIDGRNLSYGQPCSTTVARCQIPGTYDDAFFSCPDFTHLIRLCQMYSEWQQIMNTVKIG